ncbi:ABC transporter permease [Pollutibacter soli]|uniref:ABC transporter permease n=1 Tax=Pollutibacter soli TaxID=3034157 RepID=UPI00301345A0
MFKLLSSIKKDVRILLRDKVGLLLMFLMPILLAVVITAIQNSTFELVNDNKIPLIVLNRDTGEAGKQFLASINDAGIFKVMQSLEVDKKPDFAAMMKANDALVAILIPEDFTIRIKGKAKVVAAKALKSVGLEGDSLSMEVQVDPLTMMYHPVMQESFRQSVHGALKSAVSLVESKQILNSLYLKLNDEPMPVALENEILHNTTAINQVPVSRDGSRNVPNATQHNIPAWTIFAMFFVVISLGSSVVREKLNGSFLRLKTLPSAYFISLISKQITYLIVTLIQALVIFAIGVWIFPLIHLPALNLPNDLFATFVVLLICGWCAVSFAICIGVFAKTQEQANGIGAVSIVLLAAIGGLLVPSFAMPDSFSYIIRLSPLHWCLEAFYGLFLEGGNLKDIMMNLLPLLAITILFQLITIWGLRKKNLI